MIRPAQQDRETSTLDVTLTSVDEKTRSTAAMPIGEFIGYIAGAAIGSSTIPSLSPGLPDCPISRFPDCPTGDAEDPGAWRIRITACSA